MTISAGDIACLHLSEFAQDVESIQNNLEVDTAEIARTLTIEKQEPKELKNSERPIELISVSMPKTTQKSFWPLGFDREPLTLTTLKRRQLAREFSTNQNLSNALSVGQPKMSRSIIRTMMILSELNRYVPAVTRLSTDKRS